MIVYIFLNAMYLHVMLFKILVPVDGGRTGNLGEGSHNVRKEEDKNDLK